MSIKKTALTLIVVFGFLFSTWGPVQAQQQESLYFAETGHWVTGEFLTFYQSAKNPLLVYGYPITDSYQDPLTGLTVQYFQRARFEHHIEAADGQRVQLSTLGSLIYVPGKPVDLATDTPACREFPNQKYTVCYAFLTFFDKNGGVNQFGYPISNLENQDSLYVQYFEKARFEWHPELPSGEWVVLSDLGRVYFDQMVADTTLLEAKPSNNLPSAAIQLQAHVFVEKAVVSPGGQQKLNIVVQDQYLRPVSQANVAVTIDYPVGGEERYRLPLTDADGVTHFEFNVGNQPSDRIVQIKIEVTQGGLQALTGTWFRIWW